jgi:hypothetical protein
VFGLEERELSGMRAPLIFAALLLAGAVGAPVTAEDNADLASPVGQQCLSQKIHRDQCCCFAQYVRLNGGEYIDDQVFVKVMKAYPINVQQTIGPDLHQKVVGNQEAVRMAARIMIDATKICSTWDYTR